MKKINLTTKTKNPNYSKFYYNYYNLLRSAIADLQFSDCLEILESSGIPADWGIMLLPLIQADMGGDS